MLILGSAIINGPVMSLQTGGRLAVVEKAIIDPYKLRVLSYKLSGSLLSENPSFLRTNDIREVGRLGIIIDSVDELIGDDDIITEKDIYELDFQLIGTKVFDEANHRLGKITDYSIFLNGFMVEQIHVKRSGVRALTETELLINRSQIVSITDKGITVKSTAKKIKEIENLEQPHYEYVNPFRQPKLQEDHSSSARFTSS
jgi:uncharacterized protein YrrD